MKKKLVLPLIVGLLATGVIIGCENQDKKDDSVHKVATQATSHTHSEQPGVKVPSNYSEQELSKDISEVEQLVDDLKEDDVNITIE